jgi:hypothetical protein
MASFDSNLIFEKYKQVNENLGYGIGKSINVPGPGGQSTGAKVVFALVKPEHDHSECEEGKNGCTCGGCPECTKNAEDAENYAEDECGRSHSDEEVYIQAGDDAEESNCGCGQTPCMSQVKDDDDFDGEIDMARAELLKAAEYATKLFNHLANVGSLEGWTASKITKASDYLSSVYHALEYDALDANVEDEEDEDIEVDRLNGNKTARDTGYGGA